jgi:hypothetical protein
MELFKVGGDVPETNYLFMGTSGTNFPSSVGKETGMTYDGD